MDGGMYGDDAVTGEPEWLTWIMRPELCSAVAAHLERIVGWNGVSKAWAVESTTEVVSLLMARPKHLPGRGGYGRRAHLEGVHWCMYGHGRCGLGRGGLPGRIAFEVLSAWEGRKGMCGQRMP